MGDHWLGCKRTKKVGWVGGGPQNMQMDWKCIDYITLKTHFQMLHAGKSKKDEDSSDSSDDENEKEEVDEEEEMDDSAEEMLPKSSKVNDYFYKNW